MKQFAVSVIKYSDEILCGCALVIMSLLVILNVVLRYAFNYSISWAEEVATICFVWSAFLGASATYKHKFDMGVDYFVLKMPQNYQRFVKRLVSFILLAINGYIFIIAIIFTNIAWQKPTAVLGISSAIFNLALVVGFGLITFHTLWFMYHDFCKTNDKDMHL